MAMIYVLHASKPGLSQMQLQKSPKQHHRIHILHKYPLVCGSAA